MGDTKLALLILCGLGDSTTRALTLALALAALLSVWLVLREGRQALARSLPLAPLLTFGTLASLLVRP